jgi:hypothetical protein
MGAMGADGENLVPAAHQEDFLVADMTDLLADGSELTERNALRQIGAAGLGLVLSHSLPTSIQNRVIAFIGLAWSLLTQYKTMSSVYRSEELLPRQRIGPEAPQHSAGDEVRIGLMHAARGHAMMRRLYDYTNPEGFEDIVDRVGDLRRHPFLNLQALA